MSRDFVRSTSEKLLIGFISFVVFVSCDNGEIKQKDTEAFNNIIPLDKEDLLLGSWEAKWETNSDAFTVSEEYNLTMRGKVQFKENGKVKIHAYGYQGCIFLSDTMINELQYILEGDTINLLADDENFGLPYQILELQQNKVRLVLMEDIALTLTR
jgi:hypothetical protein